MCLDWIGRQSEAEHYFQKAHELDPDGRIASFYVGWHELQKGNDEAAKGWFDKSVHQGYPPYSLAENYLRILERRDRERAAAAAAPASAAASTNTPPPAPHSQPRN